MSDRARMALFNWLGDLSNQTVLDAYAGSGALAFEAISRGAKEAVCVEINRRVFSILTSNRDQLGVAGVVKCHRANIVSWLKQQPDEFLRFDLIFVDPPYDDIHSSQLQLIGAMAAPESYIVLSWPDHYHPGEALFLADYQQLNRGRYSQANLGLFYKKKRPRYRRHDWQMTTSATTSLSQRPVIYRDDGA